MVLFGNDTNTCNVLANSYQNIYSYQKEPNYWGNAFLPPKGTKEEKTSIKYGPDRRLDPRITEEMPLLEVFHFLKIHGLKIFIIWGEDEPTEFCSSCEIFINCWKLGTANKIKASNYFEV